MAEQTRCRKPRCKTQERFIYHERYVWVECKLCNGTGYALPYGSFTDLQGTLE